jgi:leucyl/phenylalanyl-tRNA--protein transferase
MRDDEPTVITAELLLRAYASGIFPMAETAASEDIFWVDPRRRGILPLDAFHVPRRLARSFLRQDFDIRIDRDFAAVVRACGERPETWINSAIEELYGELHRMGHAHSVEIWSGEDLSGGLYGVALGGAFFGESMFSRQRDASKFALIALAARLNAGGFRLLDTQFVTPHLAGFGAVEISRAEYRARLETALTVPADFFALPRDSDRQRLLQLSSQTS